MRSTIWEPRRAVDELDRGNDPGSRRDRAGVGSSGNPGLNVGKGAVELACDRAQSDSASRAQNHLPPVRRRKFFIRRRLAEESCAVSSVTAPLRSASTTLTSQDSSFVMTNYRL